MKVKGHIPVRTCVSCGIKRPKNDLIKLMTDSENRLIIDDSGRLRGRGAYVCDSLPCLERLLNNKHLKRQFRTDRDIYVSYELSGIMPLGDENRSSKSGKQQ
jgi:predicted RNA-binding protein YlxR (DUF448 family)